MINLSRTLLFCRMYTYKSSSIFSVVSSLLLLGILFFQPSTAFAQRSLECLIDGGIIVSLGDGSGSELAVTNQLNTVLSVANNSSYQMGGVGIALGFYGSSDSSAPGYIAILGDNLMFPSGADFPQPVSIDVSALPADTYDVRAVAFQGEGTDLLGALMRGIPATLEMSKESAAVDSVSQTLTINGQDVTPGQTVEIEERTNIRSVLETRNEGLEPVSDSPVYISIVQGDTPLGTAVRSQKTDIARLIPGGVRNTVAEDMFVEGGEYSVYGFLASENKATPVVVGKVQVGDRPGPDSWTYISKVGVTNLPFTDADQLTACVENLGSGSDSTMLHSLSGITFTVTAGKEEVFTKTVTNEEGGASKYFSVTPGVAFGNFTLGTTLLENRFTKSIPLGEVEEGSEIDRNEVNFTETQEVSGWYECPEGNCVSPTSPDTPPVEYVLDAETKPYWFYIGVMLASALLMYIVLRRLHPEGTGAPIGVSEDELQ